MSKNNVCFVCIIKQLAMLCAILLLMLLARPATAQLIPQGVPPGDRVLLIGIDSYKNPKNDLPLNSSIKDSRDIQEMAIKTMGFKPEQILTLFNERATRANILRAIDEWLIAGSRPGSRLLLQYSGHGAQWTDNNGEELDGKDEVIIAWDTEPGPNGPRNLIIDDELDIRIDRLRDRDLLVIIDACHSGTITRDLTLTSSAEESGATMTRLAQWVLDADAQMHGAATTRAADSALSAKAQENSLIRRSDTVRVWSAVSAAEVAWVDDQSTPKQGVFTRRLVEAVVEKRADANRNGIISNAEVLEYVRRTSQTYCTSSPGCINKQRSLTPTLEIRPEALGRDFRTGKMAPNVADNITDTLGQGASGATAASLQGSVVDMATPMRLKILPNRQVKLGREVVFEIFSPISGFLIVLDINAAGQVTQIFPNEFSRIASGRVGEKTTLRLPEPQYGFAFEAHAPTGLGTLVAVVASQSIDLTDLAPPQRGFAAVERPIVLVGEIVSRVTKALENRLSRQGLQWAYSTQEYTIVP